MWYKSSSRAEARDVKVLNNPAISKLKSRAILYTTATMSTNQRSTSEMGEAAQAPGQLPSASTVQPAATCSCPFAHRGHHRGPGHCELQPDFPRAELDRKTPPQKRWTDENELKARAERVEYENLRYQSIDEYIEHEVPTEGKLKRRNAIRKQPQQATVEVPRQDLEGSECQETTSADSLNSFFRASKLTDVPDSFPSRPSPRPLLPTGAAAAAAGRRESAEETSQRLFEKVSDELREERRQEERVQRAQYHARLATIPLPLRPGEPPSPSSSDSDEW